MKTLTFDIETYINYSLFVLRDVANKNKVTAFEVRGQDNTLTPKQIKKLKKILTKNTIVTYNGLKFDEPITAYSLKGKTTGEIFKAVQDIIVDGVSAWAFYRQAKCKKFIPNHIDIMDVARGSASLKLYGSRLGTKKLQDLPYAPETELTSKQMDEVLKYCENDNIVTQELYDYLQTDLDLRKAMGEQYNMNFMSFKGAKIAEMILVKECGYEGKTPDRPDEVYYKPPKYVKFKNPALNDLLKKIKNHRYVVSESGNVDVPNFLKEEIMFDGLPYKFGVGGLHGSVKSTAIVPEDDEEIIDIDYKSLYPSLIIENNFAPSHIGKKFVQVYQMMYDERNKVLKPAMKLVKYGSDEYNELNRQQNTMKLVLNSSFGQLGQRFSKLYDPKSMLQTTMTGQLTLMMVIEMLSLKGHKTFYANTDGITLKVKKADVKEIQNITRTFDKKTGLEMEYNIFKASYIRDVNNFVNITDDGKVKSKGTYGEPDIEKNIQTPICTAAVRQYLLKGTPIKDTIKACKDIKQFVSARTVTGGAIFCETTFDDSDEYKNYIEKNLKQNKALEKRNDNFHKEQMLVSSDTKYLGKVVRFYYSTKGKTMHYKKSGNKVPKSDGCFPMMDLKKKIPKDLDYKWYVKETIELLLNLGVTH